MSITPLSDDEPKKQAATADSHSSSTSSSGLSPVPFQDPAKGTASKEKKRARESNGSTISKTTKKAKTNSDGTTPKVDKVKDVYCHQ